MNPLDRVRELSFAMTDLAGDLADGWTRSRALASRELVAESASLIGAMAKSTAIRLDSMVNQISGIGGRFDPGSAQSVRVAARRTLSYAELAVMYEQDGIPARIVDQVADDATRKGWRFVDGSGARPEDDDVDDRPDLLAPYEDALNVRQTFRDAMARARQYGGALIWMVTDEDVPRSLARSVGGPLLEPLDLARVRDVRALHVLDPTEARALAYEDDPTSPRFRKPRAWQLFPGGAYARGTIDVDASRVLYVPGFRVSDARRYSLGGFDLSWIDVCWQAIARHGQGDAATATLMQRFTWQVVKMQDLSTVDAANKTATLDRRIAGLVQSITHLGAVVVGKDEDFASQTTSVAGWDGLCDAQLTTLCMTARFPRVLLTGDSPSGLGTDGESWRTAWSARIGSDQSSTVAPELRQFARVAFAARNGPTRGEEPEGWSLVFNPLDELSAVGRATVGLQRAQTRQIQIAIGDALPRLDDVDQDEPSGVDPTNDAGDVDDPTKEADIEDGDGMPAKARPGAVAEPDDVVDPKAPPAKPGDTPAATTPAGPDIQAQVLNAAQITAATDLVARVCGRELPKSSAIGIFRIAFPYTDDTLIDDVFRDVPDEDPEEPPAPGGPGFPGADPVVPPADPEADPPAAEPDDAAPPAKPKRKPKSKAAPKDGDPAAS